MNKKALIFLGQPPGANGVQSTRYTKLAKPLESMGWDLYFVGPDPRLTSVVLEPTRGAHCYYSSGISKARHYSVLRHRLPKSRVLTRGVFVACQAFSMLIARLKNLDTSIEFIEEMRSVGQQVLAKHKIDLIAGDCPEFEVLALAAAVAKEQKLPLFAIYEDPYGARETNNFTPHEYDRQKGIIDQANLTAFASSLTRQRYIDCGLAKQTSTYFYDSYEEIENPLSTANEARPQTAQLSFLHLGNLAQWRPIEALLSALKDYNLKAAKSIEFNNYGICYPEAMDAVKKDPILSDAFKLKDSVSWSESHRRAAASDVLVTVIGPRHQDNCPSKFFEYLSHRKPLLILGPNGNPVADLLHNLGIGVYADIENSSAILHAIRNVVEDTDKYREAYTSNKKEIERFSVNSVAEDWRKMLDRALISDDNLGIK